MEHSLRPAFVFRCKMLFGSFVAERVEYGIRAVPTAVEVSNRKTECSLLLGQAALHFPPALTK